MDIWTDNRIAAGDGVTEPQGVFTHPSTPPIADADSPVAVEPTVTTEQTVRLLGSDGTYCTTGTVVKHPKSPWPMVRWNWTQYVYEHTDDEGVDVYLEAPSVNSGSQPPGISG